VAWVFGPHPLAILFALAARLRGRRVVLGVRQDTVAYVRSRHPNRRWLHGVAVVLERIFRFLARRLPVVTVGPELASHYRHARRRLEIVVSLIGEADIVDAETALARDYEGMLRILSVGRIDAEKNPLLLADVCARLNAAGEPRWRLVVCGDGELRPELEARLAELGQTEHAEVLGYVPFGEPLEEQYRRAHVLLHTSWTEGFPQVIPEAFAAGLPVVAANVGGIADAVGDAVCLVPAGDPAAAAREVRALAADPGFREGRVRAGLEYARAHTVEAEIARVAGFIQGAA
jgi:glycosyltransferase involved in cell wall biosynthesis